MVSLIGLGMLVLGVAALILMARSEDDSKPGGEFPAFAFLIPIAVAVVGALAIIVDMIVRIYTG